MDFQNIFDFKIESVQKIEKGFSVDDKYIINNQYLVRVISKDRVERFKYVYDVQKLFNEVSLSQKVINFVIGDRISYYVTEYLPGENGLDVILNFTEEQQYNFGIEAAFELTKFHNLYPQPDFNTRENIEKYFTSKVEICRDNNVIELIPEIEDLIQLVGDNLHCLFDLNSVITHSDYHLFNMIFDGNKYIGVIDFERCRVSHILTDFRNNSPHNSPASKHFASGFIDGYLNEIFVEDFFLKYNIHDMMMSIAAIPWVMEYNPTNLDVDIAYIKTLFSSLKDPTKKPSWYVGKY